MSKKDIKRAEKWKQHFSRVKVLRKMLYKKIKRSGKSMKKTNCIKRAYIVAGEGLDEPYQVKKWLGQAKTLAKKLARERRGIHWIVFSPVCGFIDG